MSRHPDRRRGSRTPGTFRAAGRFAVAGVLAAVAALVPAIAPLPSAAAAGRATAVAAGANHACAILADRTVVCWGANGFGQLGDGTTSRTGGPVRVAGVAGATAIAAGGRHTCAIVARGAVRCWGSNEYGQLGATTRQPTSATAVRVAGLTGVTRIAAGERHTCAILTNATVRCWGSNAQGQLGNAAVRVSTDAPVAVPGIGRATAIGAGVGHTCIRLRDGSARCWGANERGQLGRDTKSTRQPILVTALKGMSSLVAGSYATCAVAADRTVRCWGWNAYGALGGGTAVASSTKAVKVARVNEVLALDAGEGLACAVVTTKTVRCWGPNDFGGLGNGTTEDSAKPVVVAGVAGATTVSVGRAFACAIAAGGVVCWGHNAYGQLGDGTTEDRSRAVAVGL